MVEFPTFMGSWPWPWPWIRAWSLPFFISHRVLPVYQISSKLKKHFCGRTDGNLPPIVLGRLIKFGSRPKNGVVWGSYGSLKITGISAIRYSVYDFLLPFHSNYVPMHRFWDIARYWLKIADCNLPHLYLVPPLGVTPLEFRRDIWQQKTSPWAIVQSCLRDPRFSHFGTIPACDRRSRWTDGHPTVAWYL